MRRLLVAILVGALVTVTVPASGVEDIRAIQPGDSMNGCTLNFVFDGVDANGAPTVYIGTAAHCVDEGDVISTPGFPSFGTVVYDDNPSDWALIEIIPRYHDDVLASVKGYPNMPTGYTDSDETLIGDQLGLSGYGLGFNAHEATRENRTGVLYSDQPDHYYSEVPAIFGDSGGPVVHMDSGKAIGIVTGAIVGVPTYMLHGPTVQGLMLQPIADDLDLSLRTV